MGHSHGRCRKLKEQYGNNLVVAAISVENKAAILGKNYFYEYDLFFTYHNDSAIVLNADYMPPMEEILSAPTKGEGRKPRIMAMISNCVGKRLAMVSDMCRAGLPIDLYGRCTIDTKGTDCQVIPTKDRYASDWRQAKIKMLEGYQMALAIENSRDDRYVTEKLYQPLQAGAIPIYWGDEHVLENGLAPIPSPSSPMKTLTILSKSWPRRSCKNCIAPAGALATKWSPTISDRKATVTGAISVTITMSIVSIVPIVRIVPIVQIVLIVVINIHQIVNKFCTVYGLWTVT